MVRIYVLLDPRNRMPFYVGSTSRSLKVRLIGHITDANREYKGRPDSEQGYKMRMEVMREIMQQGGKPIIKTLFITNEASACLCEHTCYLSLISMGFTLLQSPHRFLRNNIKSNYLM